MIEANVHTAFEWMCPDCRHSLRLEFGTAHCTSCSTTYECRDGVWHFLPNQRTAAYATFLKEYEIVRRMEGWGSTDGEYYRSLPHVPLDDPNREIWQMRGRTFESFVRLVLKPLERRMTRPLYAIDLGAGNGWISYRLARLGHRVAAVDLRLDGRDGLGAHVHYDAGFTPAQAEFERLPFTDGQFDLAVFNASLHYARDCEAAIREALRVLRPMGRLVVLDSPVFGNEDAGRQMLRERERYFMSRFGFASNSLQSENFLTRKRLAEVSGISLTYFRPFYGIRWMIRPIVARLLGQRQPADFLIIAADKPAHFTDLTALPHPIEPILLESTR